MRLILVDKGIVDMTEGNDNVSDVELLVSIVRTRALYSMYTELLADREK